MMVSVARAASSVVSKMLLVLLCLLLSPVDVATAATEMDLLPTYRQGTFVWNKAGWDNFPNILSELKWENLRIRGIKGILRHDIDQRSYLEASGEYGWIYAGTNQDSDYDGDNRTEEYSRSNNSGNGGHVFDASLAMGWKMRDTKTQRTSLLAGYGYSRQLLRMTNGFQTIPATGPFAGLNASYRTVWQGPWLGLQHEERLNKRLNLIARLEYHWLSYDAEARWNLRPDLEQPVTNNHWADGSGIVASLGLNYAAGSRWRLGAYVDYTTYSTGYGTDQVNLADGTTKFRVRLNEARWDSWAYRLQATYRF